MSAPPAHCRDLPVAPEPTSPTSNIYAVAGAATPTPNTSADASTKSILAVVSPLTMKSKFAESPLMVTVSAPASIDNAESELSDFTKKSTNATPSWLIVTAPSALLSLPVVTVK